MLSRIAAASGLASLLLLSACKARHDASSVKVYGSDSEGDLTFDQLYRLFEQDITKVESTSLISDVGISQVDGLALTAVDPESLAKGTRIVALKLREIQPEADANKQKEILALAFELEGMASFLEAGVAGVDLDKVNGALARATALLDNPPKPDEAFDAARFEKLVDKVIDDLNLPPPAKAVKANVKVKVPAAAKVLDKDDESPWVIAGEGEAEPINDLTCDDDYFLRYKTKKVSAYAFKKASQCRTALANANQGVVCAPTEYEEFGPFVLASRNQLDNDYDYAQLNGCIKAVKNAKDFICLYDTTEQVFAQVVLKTRTMIGWFHSFDKCMASDKRLDVSRSCLSACSHQKVLCDRNSFDFKTCLKSAMSCLENCR